MTTETNNNPATYGVEPGIFAVLLLGESLVINDGLPREDWRHKIIARGGAHTDPAKALAEVDARRMQDGHGYNWCAIGDQSELTAAAEAGVEGEAVYDALISIGLTPEEADSEMAG